MRENSLSAVTRRPVLLQNATNTRKPIQGREKGRLPVRERILAPSLTAKGLGLRSALLSLTTATHRR